MTTWILVMSFQANVWYGWQREEIEYQSKDECYQALKEIRHKDFDKFRAYCKPKGG